MDAVGVSSDESADRDGQRSTLGVRERNRTKLRRRLSETATAMFLERGFDAVRVSDVAQVCGVSTKTVWNHFATKDALLFDRGEVLAAVLRDAAARPTDVLSAVLACIQAEIDAADKPRVAGFHDLVQSTQAFAQLCELNPGLRAATSERLDHLTQLATEAIAAQDASEVQAPRNQIAASALIGLWRVYLGSVLRLADAKMSTARMRKTVRADVADAAAIVERVMPAVNPQSGS